MKRHLTLVLAALAAASDARAEPPKHDVAAATSLFYEARDLMAKGRYSEACPKLEESQRLDSGIGTQFNLADCNEHIGKVATAWAGFVEVAVAARIAGQAQREKIARQRAEALAPRVPRLAVDVASPPPGLEVKRDGAIVGKAVLGTAVPVDPGSHKVQATAPGKQPWETSVHVAEGKTVNVDVPALTDVVVAKEPPPTEVPGAPVETTAAPALTAPATFPEPADDHTGTAQRTVGFVIGTIGVAGLAIGGGFGLRSIAKRDDSRAHCNGDLCDAQGVALRDDAIRAGNVATGTMIAGGLALAAGILLVATAPSSSPHVSASASVGPDGAGVRVGGSF